MYQPDTAYAPPYSGPSRRAELGAAIVSTMGRRRWLMDRLLEAGIHPRALLLQCDDTGIAPPADERLLPPLRAPLLLDTGGLSPTFLTILLTEMTALHADVATIALVVPTDRLALALTAACPAIYAVAPDTIDPMMLRPWLMHVGAVGTRRREKVRPAYLDVAPPSNAVSDPGVLTILTALARARTVEEATAASPLGERTFYRRLEKLRAALGLPPARQSRFRPPELMDSLLAAMAADRT